MELLALLSNRDDITIPGVKSALQKYTVYPLKTVEELEDLYGNIPLNLFIIDTVSYRLSFLEKFLRKIDDDMVVLIVPEGQSKFQREDLPASVYECITDGSIKTDLLFIVERALEKQKYRNEMRLMRQSLDKVPQAQAHMPVGNRSDTEIYSGRLEPVPGGRYLQEKVVVNFAKMLTVSFDMRKLFDHFMDSVMEIVRVSKMSVMLRDKEGYRVKTHFGLDPYVAEHVVLGADTELAARLAKTGRIIHMPVMFPDTASVEIKKGMDLLQCVVSFPMVYKGKLIGIFNINGKITEEPFYRDELEIIYVLCNYLAAAVKDIDLYHQMWYQKEFTNNILSSINSGMIAIDRYEKITVFNQQASEILDLDASEMIGSDLRALPSPLGDILYETMVSDTSYKRYEVEIRPSGLPLGINSYRLLDEQAKPLGAGIIFSDLSDLKKLEEQRRRADKLKAVNDLMAKIAHEVRNPLTSIQTYTQLLSEKFGDDELYNFYVSTVSQSISRLDSLIDRLVTFSSTEDFNFCREEIGDLIEEAADYVSKNIPRTHKLKKQLVNKSFYVSADRKQFIKAIYYLVLEIIDRTPEGSLIHMSTDTIMHGTPSIIITLEYEGDTVSAKQDSDLSNPLLDINNLGTELNVPIGFKIIEGHNGTLEIKSRKGKNVFAIKLPIIDRRSDAVSIKGGYIRGHE